MTANPSTPPFFGDLLARARQSWIRAMASQLVAHGFTDYRRSDAVAVRWLAHTPLSLGAFASKLGVSRQTARKVVHGLEARGFATIRVDSSDARRRNVTLTASGQAYATAVIKAVHDLNGQLREKVDPVDFAGAMAVLSFVKDAFGA